MINFFKKEEVKQKLQENAGNFALSGPCTQLNNEKAPQESYQGIGSCPKQFGGRTRQGSKKN